MTDPHSPKTYGAATLHWIAMLVSPPALCLQQTFSWMEKTDYLRVALSDLPGQLAAARAVRQQPGERLPDTDVRMFDGLPELRLRMALEFTAHTAYSLAEIAAQVANKATARSGYRLPAGFNGLCKAVQSGEVPGALIENLGDLSWYGVVREMRTEWTHYSAPFVSSFRDPPEFRVHTERPVNQRRFLGEPAFYTFDEYVEAVTGAVQATERLAHHLITQHIVPDLDRDVVRDHVVRNAHGFPLIRDSKVVLEKRTVGQLLKDCGVDD